VTQLNVHSESTAATEKHIFTILIQHVLRVEFVGCAKLHGEQLKRWK